MPAWRAVLFGILAHGLSAAAEPPAIRRQGVVNAASPRPAAVGGAVARGSLISIHGVRFAAAIAANRVALESGGQARPLTVVHAAAQRLEVWIPADAALGPARITVTSNGLQSAPEAIVVLKGAPGLFSANGEGWGPARSTASAAPGGRLTLAATGLSAADRPDVLVGGARARVLSVRPAAAPAYTAQLDIQLPPDAPEGCYVPVYARLPNAPPSNTVTIAVHRGGGACAAAPNDPASGWQGGKTAILSLTRTVRRTLDAPADRTDDEVAAAFTDVPAAKAHASPLLLVPPPGTCATYAGALNAGTAVGSSLWTLLFGGVLGDALDAGSAISVRSQAVQLRVPFVNGAPGLYRRILSTGPGRVPPQNRVGLDAGRLGLAGSGGSQVGAFTASLPAPAAFRASTPADAIPRSQPLTVEWSGANAEDTLAIVLVGSDPNLNVAGLTYCSAPPAAGKFTIPADMLGQLPAGRGDLVVGSWWGRAISPAPSGVGWMMALSVFARSYEVRIE